MAPKQYTIDATNQKLGRLATQVAMILMGKDSVDYAPNKVANVKVTIENADKLSFHTNKLWAIYDRYSGYPGGRKIESRKHLMARRGMQPVVELAVRRMLPKNRLQKLRMQNLIIKTSESADQS